MILPTLEQWNAELDGKVVMHKFNCNKANKDLGIAVSWVGGGVSLSWVGGGLGELGGGSKCEGGRGSAGSWASRWFGRGWVGGVVWV